MKKEAVRLTSLGFLHLKRRQVIDRGGRSLVLFALVERFSAAFTGYRDTE